MKNEKDYSYNRFGSKGARVGQAVMDILSKPQAEQTVEETLDEFGRDYLNNIRKFAEEEKEKYDGEFHIFSLLNKDLTYFGVENVLRHWEVSRVTDPDPAVMMVEYQHFAKTCFKVDPKGGEITLMWTLPSYQDCLQIEKRPSDYDEGLVKMVRYVLSRVSPAKKASSE